MINGILYKRNKILSTEANKLVLPTYIAIQILNNLHHDKQFHISAPQMMACFSSTYYTHELKEICLSISNQCGACTLNNNLYKKKTTGDERSIRHELTPGSHYSMDALYLNRTTNGNTYCYILVDMLTGYTILLPTHSLNTSTASTAVRNIFSVLSWSPFFLTSFWGRQC